MKRSTLGAALGLMLAAGLVPSTSLARAPMSSSSADTLPDSSPFSRPSALPYQLPPFDRIGNDDFRPGLIAGMAAQRREIGAITADPRAPDFDNTVLALERSGQLLNRVTTVFYNLASSHTNDTLEQLQGEFAPLLTAHSDAILLDEKLFARIEAVWNTRQKFHLDAESLRLLERYRTQFIRAGARLAEAQKAELRQINADIATYTTRFEQNLLKETVDSAVRITRREELAGLPDDEIAAAAAAAKARGFDGEYLLALQNTTGQPVLARLQDRGTRAKVYKASISRGARGNVHDNRELITRLVSLRARRAVLLGYPTHAAYVLADETARTPDAVNAMLARLAPAAVANARREAAALEKLLRQDHRDASLLPWDWAYYSEKLRQQQYDFDESAMRPYFELDNVLQRGVFHAASQLYGLQFRRRSDLPVYHPDVQVYEVLEKDGAALGLFLFDPFQRDSKRGGAWMNEFVAQSRLLGNRPVIVNNLNVPKPADGQPVLMSWDEVITLFHEFGHALHGLLSDVQYPMFSGTNVPRDFVEYPSQVNEMWAIDPQVLANYARHHQTGAVMPKALLDKLLASEQFNQGFETTEYLAAALLDQRWHQRAADAAAIKDVAAFENAALREAGVALDVVPPRYRSPYFAHVFAGGYSAGYYAYIWSEVLDADTVEWFRENGGLKAENGARFRAGLLSRGGSADALTLYRGFRGRDADIAPLLKRRGLAPAN